MFDDSGEYLQNAKFGLAVVASPTGVKGDSERDRTLNEAQNNGGSKLPSSKLPTRRRADPYLGTGKNEQLGENGKVQIVVYSRKPASGKEEPSVAR